MLSRRHHRSPRKRWKSREMVACSVPRLALKDAAIRRIGLQVWESDFCARQIWRAAQNNANKRENKRNLKHADPFGSRDSHRNDQRSHTGASTSAHRRGARTITGLGRLCNPNVSAGWCMRSPGPTAVSGASVMPSTNCRLQIIRGGGSPRRRSFPSHLRKERRTMRPTSHIMKATPRRLWV
jgi:hypothetical protein